MAGADSADEIRLGQVELPEGILIVLDAGLGRYWRHDNEPASPRAEDPPQHDLRIVGQDAERAGIEYDRGFDPLYLYDCPNAVNAAQQLASFAQERQLDARAEPCQRRIRHTERAHRALLVGGGLGVVEFNNLWAVAASGLPSDRPLTVTAPVLPDGEFANRLRHIDIVVDEGEIVQRQSVTGVMVDHGQFLFSGLAPLSVFEAGRSKDGLADYVFWGDDAHAVAEEFGAKKLGEEHFGWVDLPTESIGGKARPLQKWIAEHSLRVGVDYRPHCNLEALNTQIRSSSERTGEIQLAGARVVACDNRWGDGVFEVSRMLGGDGRTLRVRVELCTNQRMQLFRKIAMRHLGAIVSKKILDDAQPIQFADRDEPRSERDSGWMFSAGTESDAYANNTDNLVIVPMAQMLKLEPALEAIMLQPVGSQFHRDGDVFVTG